MNIRPLVATGTLMGIGMGGFFDGILFHQVLQLHSMLSATLPQETVVNIKTSMIWDGFFHTMTWLTTAISIYLFWRVSKDRDTPMSGTIFSGALILGWGIFNIVEGIINHHILEIHHVVERLGLSVYDYLFILLGLAFMIVGLAIIKAGIKALSYDQ